MGSDSALTWAKKMADALGGSKSGSPAGAPAGSNGGPSGASPVAAPGEPSQAGAPKGSGSKSGGGGAPAGDAPKGGGAPAGDSPKGGGAPAGDSPKGDGPSGGAPDGKPAGAGDPTAPPTAATPAAADAKGYAEAAKKALADITALQPQAAPVDAEIKKAVTSAQAEKKKIDDANSQLDATLKSLPPATKVPAPKGPEKSAERYDSAIEISGNMRKAQQESTSKLDSFRGTSVADEVTPNADVSAKEAKTSAAKLKKLAEQAAAFAEASKSAAAAAATAAAESKSKADQANKASSSEKKEGEGDKKETGPDKAVLQKTAQEDAQHAATAKEAATKSQAAAKQLEASSKNAESQQQSVEKLGQEIKSAVEAFSKKQSTIHEKIQPYQAAIDESEKQEAKCKQELIDAGGNPESVLQRRYEKLGGDAELKKALDEEDNAFVAFVANDSASWDEWLKRKNGELDDYKGKLQNSLDRNESKVKPREEWLKKHQPESEGATKEATALGPKLETEPGKELQHEIHQRKETIAKFKEIQVFHEANTKVIKETLESLKERYDAIKKQYDAAKKRAADSRTEVDNILQMDSMTLDAKVDFLQVRPKPVRDRVQKKLESESKIYQNMTSAHTKAEQVEFTPPPDTTMPEMDWEPVKAKIKDLQSKTLEQLKEKDPKLAGIQEEYDKAGGDAALLEKRLKEWKAKVDAADLSDKEYTSDHKKRTEALTSQLGSASLNLKDQETSRQQIATTLSQKQEWLKAAKDTTDVPTTQQKAEWDVAERDIKRLEKELANQEAVLEASKASKASAEKLIEQQRQRYEVGIKERLSMPRPESADIQKMPIRAKYTELTGKTAPA